MKRKENNIGKSMVLFSINTNYAKCLRWKKKDETKKREREGRKENFE